VKADLQIFSRRGHREFPVLDAFGPDQAVGDFLHLAAFALDHQDFKAMMFIEMDVQRGPKKLLVLVLKVGEGVAQVADGVVVDDRDGADDLPILVPLLLDERVTDEIANRLRSIGVALLLDDPIEAFEQLWQTDRIICLDGVRGPRGAAIAALCTSQPKASKRGSISDWRT